ncbi:MAG: ABC transporter substrate-binding protein [Romboutsia sp.]
MKISKKIKLSLLSLVIGLSIVGCSKTETKKEESKNTKLESVTEKKDNYYPVTISTHNSKKEEIQVTIKEKPKKVLAVYQDSIETMLALGLEDNIVAAAGLDHKVKDEYKEAFSKVKYLDEFTPSKETVTMLQPDLILGWYSLFSDKNIGDVNYWQDKDVNTYMALNSGAVEPKTIKNECDDILNIGKIFNVEDKAKKIVDNINNRVDEVVKSEKDKKQQTTLIIEFYDDKISGYGKTTLGGDMVTKLGAKLLNEDGNALSKEDLISLNPDSIFVVYMNREDDNKASETKDLVMKDKALQSLSAIKNDRVYPIELGQMYCSGVRTIDGIETFANGLYPSKQ